MHYYIASSLGNIEQTRRLHDFFTAAGHTCTYQWFNLHGSVYDATKSWEEQASTLAAVAEAGVLGVLNAGIVIVLLPGGNGTHVELGVALSIACASRMTCVIIAGEAARLPKEPIAFWYHPAVLARVWEADEAALFASLLKYLPTRAPASPLPALDQVVIPAVDLMADEAAAEKAEETVGLNKAVVASDGIGNGCIICYVGNSLHNEIYGARFTDLCDLGLDEAPQGVSIWEGSYIWQGDRDGPGGTMLTSANSAFRAPTEAEWTCIRAKQNPWLQLVAAIPAAAPAKAES